MGLLGRVPGPTWAAGRPPGGSGVPAGLAGAAHGGLEADVGRVWGSDQKVPGTALGMWRASCLPFSQWPHEAGTVIHPHSTEEPGDLG